jgi:hypothetical protein
MSRKNTSPDLPGEDIFPISRQVALDKEEGFVKHMFRQRNPLRCASAAKRAEELIEDCAPFIHS